VGTNADGNAVAVWLQYDGTRYNVWARHYAAGAGWGPAMVIETSSQTAAQPSVAVVAEREVGQIASFDWGFDGLVPRVER